ncbi:MAG: hypothetical protein WC000_13060 [Dokdonella sp.]
MSLGVRELACRLSLDAASFARAGECLLKASGLRLGDETFRKLVESEGKAVIAAQDAEQLEFDWRASDCRVAQADGRVVTRLYLGCDGVMVPTVTAGEKHKRRVKALARRKRLKRRLRGRGQPRGPLPAMRAGTTERFKEMKLVGFYDQEREHRLARATRKGPKHAGRLMRQGMTGLLIGGADQRIALVDGAPWIARQIRHRRPAFDPLTLDFWHLSEHVHQARRELFGESDPAGVAWAEQLLSAIRHQGYEPFWQKLIERRSRTRSPRRRKALDGLMHYVAERRTMLDYPRHERQGWDIGSGPTESMCKTLTRRVKGSGKRWDADNAEAMIALEGLLQSDQWSGWWDHRLQQAA